MNNVAIQPGDVKLPDDPQWIKEKIQNIIEGARAEAREFKDALAEVGPVTVEGYYEHPAHAPLSLAMHFAGLPDDKADAFSALLLSKVTRDQRGQIRVDGMDKEAMLEDVKATLEWCNAMAVAADLIFETDHMLSPVSERIQGAV